MIKVNELQPPSREAKRKKYMELVEVQQQMLAQTRETINRVLTIIIEELEKAPAENAHENNESKTAKNNPMSAVNLMTTLARLSNALVKIIPLELQLAAIDSVSMDENYTQITDPEYLAMLDKYCDEWQEQRRQYHETVEAEKAAEAAKLNGETPTETSET